MVRGQSNGGGASQLNFLFGGEEQVTTPGVGRCDPTLKRTGPSSFSVVS